MIYIVNYISELDLFILIINMERNTGYKESILDNHYFMNINDSFEFHRNKKKDNQFMIQKFIIYMIKQYGNLVPKLRNVRDNKLFQKRQNSHQLLKQKECEPSSNQFKSLFKKQSQKVKGEYYRIEGQKNINFYYNLVDN